MITATPSVPRQAERTLVAFARSPNGPFGQLGAVDARLANLSQSPAVPLDKDADTDELGAWLSDEAKAHVALWRCRPSSEVIAELEARHRWLHGDDTVARVLGRATDRSVDPALGGALQDAVERHVARAQSLGPSLDALAAWHRLLATPVDRAQTAFSDAAPGLLRAERVSEAAAGIEAWATTLQSQIAVVGGARVGAVGSEFPTSLRDEARAWLQETEGLAEEARAWLLARTRPVRAPDWALLGLALTGGELAPAFAARDRWRRLGRDIQGLGLERELASIHIEPRAVAVGPHLPIAAVHAPGDVRIGASTVDHGVLGELAAMEALGRALARCFVSPALPAALRWPIAGTAGRALGAALARLLADRRHLSRARGLSRARCEDAARVAVAALLFGSRLDAALGAAGESECPDEFAVDAAGLAAKACLTSLPGPLALLMTYSALAGASYRLRARIGGLCLGVALRDRFDSDWQRNPRAAESLRSIGNQGALMNAARAVESLGGKLSVRVAAGHLEAAW